MKPAHRFASLLLSLGLLLAPGASRLSAQTPGATGTLQGVVLNSATGHYVEGAEVVLESANRTERTDSQGRFSFAGLPAGRYKVVAEPAGASRAEASAEVGAGRTSTVMLRLESEIVAMQPLMVTGQVEGQAQSLNIQKTSENIRNVVSGDALANSRLGEVGEALMGIPGVYLEISTHQPVRAVVRGMSWEFNSVAVDGIQIGTWQGTREAQVNSYPAENLARAEVTKSVTPDQEGSSIGGTINLVSKRAFDLPARVMRLSAGATFNHQLRNWDKSVGFEYGNRFGADKRIGVFSAVNLYRSDRGYHDESISYAVDAADNFGISVVTLLDRIEKGSWRLKYTGSVDFKVSDATVLSLRAIFSDDRRHLSDYRTFYRPGTRTNVTPNSATTTNGRIDTDRQFREPETINGQVSLNLEHNLDPWKFDGTVAVNRITNTYSDQLVPVMSITGINMNYDRSARDFPTFTITNGRDLSNPALLTFGNNTRNNYDSRDLGYHAELNAKRRLASLPFKASLKTGFRWKYHNWKQGTDTQGVWTYTGPLRPADLALRYANARFMREADGRAQLALWFPDIEKYRDAFHHRPNEFTRSASSDSMLAQNKKRWAEDIYAGYFMGTATVGGLTVIPGVRFEQTEFVGKANQLDTRSGTLQRVTPTRTTSSYGNLLPGVNAIYEFNRSFLLRGAVTKTLARPNQQSLLPVRTVDDVARTITDGNPNLDVTESVNYDFNASYFLKPLGVVSAGVFQKELTGFYFNRGQTITSGDFTGYQLTRPEMGQGGRTKGLEVDVQKRLTFLPGWLSGFGIGANHTWIDSSGVYPGRTDALPLFRAAKRSGNLNLFYARGPIDIRAFVNRRSPYLGSVGTRRALDTYQDERTTLNLFAKYRLNDRWELNLDINNATDAVSRTYQGNPSNPTGVRYFDWAANFRMGINL